MPRLLLITSGNMQTYSHGISIRRPWKHFLTSNPHTNLPIKPNYKKPEVRIPGYKLLLVTSPKVKGCIAPLALRFQRLRDEVMLPKTLELNYYISLVRVGDWLRITTAALIKEAVSYVEMKHTRQLLLYQPFKVYAATKLNVKSESVPAYKLSISTKLIKMCLHYSDFNRHFQLVPLSALGSNLFSDIFINSGFLDSTSFT